MARCALHRNANGRDPIWSLDNDNDLPVMPFGKSLVLVCVLALTIVKPHLFYSLFRAASWYHLINASGTVAGMKYSMVLGGDPSRQKPSTT